MLSAIGHCSTAHFKTKYITVDSIAFQVWNTDHKPENTRRAVEQSLKDLQTNYIDMYLIHWPIAFKVHVVFVELRNNV